MPAFPRPFGAAEGWLWLLCRPVANLAVSGLVFGQLAARPDAILPGRPPFAARHNAIALCIGRKFSPRIRGEPPGNKKTPAKPAF